MLISAGSFSFWEENTVSWENRLLNCLSAGVQSHGPFVSSGDVIVLGVDPKAVVCSDAGGMIRGIVKGAIVGGIGGTVAIAGVGTVAGAAACGLATGFINRVTASASAAVGSEICGWIGWCN